MSVFGWVKSWTGIVATRVRFATQLEPLSYWWGTDRGLPPHRKYLEDFLEQHRSRIRGFVLEFQEDRYATHYGGDRIQQLDILHIDASNAQATLIGDLTAPNSFPSDAFDCIICTHVLHVIFEFRIALRELFRMLKPGGALIVAVPQLSMNGVQYGELWRFTPLALTQCLVEVFGESSVTVEFYGNSLTAAGDLRGMIVSEFTARELSYHDERFAHEVCGLAVKTPQGLSDRLR